LDTAIQILWKLAVSDVSGNASIVATVTGALSSRYFYLAMAAFIAQLVNWLRVLARADLSFAQPFTALSYITVLTLSSHSLHEKISLLKILGVVMIFLASFLSVEHLIKRGWRQQTARRAQQVRLNVDEIIGHPDTSGGDAVESVAQVCLKIGASGGPRALAAPYQQMANG